MSDEFLKYKQEDRDLAAQKMQQTLDPLVEIKNPFEIDQTFDFEQTVIDRAMTRSLKVTSGISIYTPIDPEIRWKWIDRSCNGNVRLVNLSNTYEGQLVNGTKTGVGKEVDYIYTNSYITVTKYEGDFNGQRSGNGKLTAKRIVYDPKISSSISIHEIPLGTYTGTWSKNNFIEGTIY